MLSLTIFEYVIDLPLVVKTLSILPSATNNGLQGFLIVSPICILDIFLHSDLSQPNDTNNDTRFKSVSSFVLNGSFSLSRFYKAFY